MRFGDLARRPESVTLILTLAAVVLASLISPYFLVPENLARGASSYVEVGLMALGLTFVIISGHIDLSVASILALSGTALGKCLQAGLPVAVALLAAAATGLLCGFINGFVVTRTGMPSLIVTLGTFALFGGIAQGLVGYTSIGDFPDSFVGWDGLSVGGWPVPVVALIVAALILGFVLHATTIGRRVYLVGLNRESGRYAGIDIRRVELFVFCLSGLLSGFAAIFLVSRSGVVVYNLASGYELTAITVVVVGGASIYGGSGSIFGTVIALVLIATLQRGMSLASISAPMQLIVIGTLLIGAIAVTTIAKRIGAWRRTRSKTIRPMIDGSIAR